MVKIKVSDARSLTALQLHDMRKRVVAAVQSGSSYVNVAATFGISRQAVARWSRTVEKSGVRALKPCSKGRPAGGKSKDWQSKRIIKILIEHLPDQLKLPFSLWTREAIVLLIKKRFRITLSVWTIGRLLKRWGFTPQKPARRAYERNPEAVKLWLKEVYPAIHEAARRENALILWEDEMGLRSDANVKRTYGLKGKTPLVFLAQDLVVI